MLFKKLSILSAILCLLLSFQANIYAKESLKFTEKEKAWLKNHSVIKVHNESNWPPFNYNKNGKPSGFSIEYMDLLANKIGMKVQYVTGEWGELLDQAFKKELDVMLNIVKTPERQKRLLYTDSYAKNPNVIIAKYDSAITDTQSMFGKKVAYPAGFFYDELLKSTFPQIKRVPLKGTLECLKAIQFGKAEAALVELAVANHLIRENLITGLEIKGEFKSGNPEIAKLNIAVRNDWPELVSILKKAMASVELEEIRKLQNKWIGDSIEEQSDKEPKITLSQDEQAWIAENPIIKVAATPDWPPFEFQDSDLYKGFHADIIRLATSKVGLKIKPVFGKWSVLVDKLKKEELDLCPGLNSTEERKEYLIFTGPFSKASEIIISRTDDDINSIKEIEGRTVAVEKGYVTETILRKFYPKIKLLVVQDTLQALKEVVVKNADAYVGSQAVALYLLKKNHITGLKQAAFIKGREPTVYRIGVIKSKLLLKNILQKSLDAISQEEMTQLEKKWFGVSQKKHDIDFTSSELDWLENHKLLKLGIDSSWVPIEFFDKSGKYSGISSGFISAIADRLQIKMEPVKGISWSQAVEGSITNDVDILPAIAPTIERKKYLNFTKTYISLPIVIAVRQNLPFLNSINDLSEYKIGVVKDYYTDESISRDYPDLNLARFPTLKKGLKDLDDGKIDVFIDTLSVITHEITVSNLKNIKISAPTEYKYDLSMGVRKDWPELVTILNKAISNISEQEKRLIKNTWLAPVEVKFGIDLTKILMWAIPIAVTLSLIIVFVIVWNRRLGSEVAERKKAESKLKSLQQTLNIALEASNTGIWQYNLQDSSAGNIYMHDQWFKQVGYTRDEFEEGQDVFDLIIHPDDKESAYKAIDDHRKGSTKSYETEFRLRAKDGAWRWILSKGQATDRDADGKPTQLTGAHLDITERKNFEAALVETHKKITDSIQYASMIQNALLPEMGQIANHFEDAFVIWEPKDVVGGDIFFFEELRSKNEILLLVIDCTGHGVPGAFVTALVKAVEEQVMSLIKSEEFEISPAKVLGYFNRNLKRLLKQESKQSISNAGFDGGVIYYNKKDKILKFAGAETPLFIVQNGAYQVIKGDRHSIGYKKSDVNYKFKNHEIEIKDETCIYLTTDGYIDQNGGDKGYPFGKKRLKELYLDNYSKPFDDQKSIFLNTIKAYQGEVEKNDDMTMIGLKICP